MQIRPIRTDEDYRAMLSRITLLCRDAVPGDEKDREIDVLEALVELWEIKQGMSASAELTWEESVQVSHAILNRIEILEETYSRLIGRMGHEYGRKSGRWLQEEVESLRRLYARFKPRSASSSRRES